MSQTTIEAYFYAAGVLTDVTSAVLSDVGGTFGIRRKDTLAVVVADGTAFTNSATGTYTYTFTDPAYDLEYEYATEFVYDGKTYRVTGDISGTPSTTTLADSYVTLAEAEAFMLTRLDTNIWDSETENRRERALITASQNYLRLLRLKADVNFDAAPDDLKNAIVLIALALLDGFDADYDRQSLSVASQREASITETFDKPYNDAYRATGIPSFEAWRLIYPYLAPITAPIMRVS